MDAQLVEGSTTPERLADMDETVVDELIAALQSERG